MKDSRILLKDRYLKNLKKKPDLFLGIELEFPIVELDGKPVDIQMTKTLMVFLKESLSLEIERYDMEGNPIQLVDPVSEDRILFEVSYTTLEFAFGRAKKISEVEQRFNIYFSLIQKKLGESNHALIGAGLHPQWEIMDHQPVAYSRYRMLMSYLQLCDGLSNSKLHSYPSYGAFICGSQVQLDVSRSNYIRVINAFNQIEAAKAYLFANSEFNGSDWDTKISRDIFWEDSMHGIFPENVGVNDHLFLDEDDFFKYLDRTAIFTAERNGETFYFYPIQVKDYLLTPEFEAYTLDGRSVLLQPREADLNSHRSYQYQDLTTRGTVEFRSVCTQPLDRTFAPAAFHLGLLTNLKQLEDYLETAAFFSDFGRDYKLLRRQFSRKNLFRQEELGIQQFAKDLLALAEEGLRSRNYKEEAYLEILKKDFV